MSLHFTIEKKLSGTSGEKFLGRVGKITTPHGVINTPAFVVVGTKATVKALSPEQVKSLGAEVVLANTYHLYLQPGEEVLKAAGGLHKFMNWNGPTMTDSGGFQVFSLGQAMNAGVSKVASGAPQTIDEPSSREREEAMHASLAKIDEDGVTFKSIIDGSSHRFTPERSMEIQHNIGADIIFAFDECTSPFASHEYQKEAMDRTHRWAQRSLDHHKKLQKESGNDGQSLFGIVQGGRFEDLRKESARIIGGMDFEGFGIGGSFDKEDMYTVVGWVNEILPEGKPRHLLGIGEPADLFGGIENGADTFDCVAPTRLGRNGALYTAQGRININNAKYSKDFSKIDSQCGCYTCTNYTPAYLSHLFRADEMFAGTLASLHNLYFLVNLVKEIRQAMLEDRYFELKEKFLKDYYGAKSQ